MQHNTQPLFWGVHVSEYKYIPSITTRVRNIDKGFKNMTLSILVSTYFSKLPYPMSLDKENILFITYWLWIRMNIKYLLPGHNYLQNKDISLKRN